MATVAVNAHLRIGSSFQDGSAYFNRLQKPRLAVPLPKAPQPDPDQLQYEKELLAHQLKLAKSQITELQQQLTAPPPQPPAPPALAPQSQLLPTLSTSIPDTASNHSPTPSHSSSGPAPARLAPTGYPPTAPLSPLPPTAAPIHIRRPTSALLPTLSAPNPSSVSSSVSGYLSQLTYPTPHPPTSPIHHSGPNLPHAPRTATFLNSLPTSPTAPAPIRAIRSVPASPHQAPLTAFMYPSPSLRSLQAFDRSAFGRHTHHGDDARSLTSDEARSRSDLLVDPLDMFASEELGLGSVQEDVQVESLQAEVDRLKAVVDLEDAEKVHLQRRVAELEDSNHSLRRQLEQLHQKLSKLDIAALDVSMRDQ